MRISAALALSLTLSSSPASAWTMKADVVPSTTTRRGAFSTIASTASAAAAAAAVISAAPAPGLALEECPSGSNNCVRTSWSPPGGTSKADAVRAVRDVVNAYPQDGQDKVDGGGWKIATDDLDGSGTARIEYMSAGTGFFAKAFNGGKPFVDDLKLEVQDGGTVQVKSQSRVGDSDLGVNQKRVDYLAAALKTKGWSV
mmetsp:Transcript_34431/g.75364  ORF Transcript_34431/g.75364 Transcript_34431/m.75364 type:complete len:199 (-) Transcript_34431:239-835(-)|eukprot:CAMPEP_0178516510 /NCGR_PEP_ID=MMETSP0696-20121128/25153_1 /TAXON_ID=265572 /ORGANISM="Extubocellulus spinifer, Strain CCMP396" /LENGTH=198 /DNA_ID=CAMNT_0020146793 /DNA_START=45 /DNA_END=641 /DNA_ORIENTATION=+